TSTSSSIGSTSFGPSNTGPSSNSLPNVSRLHFLSLAFLPNLFLSLRFASGSRQLAYFFSPANWFSAASDGASRMSLLERPKVRGEVSRQRKPPPPEPPEAEGSAGCVSSSTL